MLLITVVVFHIWTCKPSLYLNCVAIKTYIVLNLIYALYLLSFSFSEFTGKNTLLAVIRWACDHMCLCKNDLPLIPNLKIYLRTFDSLCTYNKNKKITLKDTIDTHILTWVDRQINISVILNMFVKMFSY